MTVKNILFLSFRFRDCRLNIIKPKHKFFIGRFRNVERISFEDFKMFTEEFLLSLQPRMLIQGNINKDQALFIAENICRTFRCINNDDCTSNQLPTANDISIGTTYYKLKSMFPHDKKSVIKNYYQIGKASPVLETKLEILQKIIREPLFNMLRTQEQLSYSVSCSVKREYKMLGFSITIESQEMKYPAWLVDEKIEIFLKHFLTTLHRMSDDDFETIKNSIIALKQSTENDLMSEVERNWKEVMRGLNKFDRSKLEIKKMEVTNKIDVIRFYEEHFICPESVRKLSVQVLGNADGDADTDSHCENGNQELKYFHLHVL